MVNQTESTQPTNQPPLPRGTVGVIWVYEKKQNGGEKP